MAFAVPRQSATAFVQLELRDARNRLVSENLYWVPAKTGSARLGTRAAM